MSMRSRHLIEAVVAGVVKTDQASKDLLEAVRARNPFQGLANSNRDYLGPGPAVDPVTGRHYVHAPSASPFECRAVAPYHYVCVRTNPYTGQQEVKNLRIDPTRKNKHNKFYRAKVKEMREKIANGSIQAPPKLADALQFHQRTKFKTHQPPDPGETTTDVLNQFNARP